jgi:hypothetical protein
MRRSILRVLELREQRSRRELARSTRAASEVRAQVETLEQVVAAVDARVRANFDERLSGGSRTSSCPTHCCPGSGGCPDAVQARRASGTENFRTVAALMEMEQHARSLLTARAQVAELKQQSLDQLAQLEQRRRLEASRWRKDDVKLAHAGAIAGREAITRAARRDMDDFTSAVPVAMAEPAA